jgi:hypothetical protein
VKIDSLFYRLFQEVPAIVLQLDLKARFNAVPEGLQETLNEVTEAELLDALKTAIVSP